MANSLRNETSPYLLQHADNPVQWQAWNDAALAEARETGKPILLSIGYSACHWCHVMAHESFEDAETAELMNSLYISIKVDREERPDLDRIYQLSQQMFTGRAGGWPLTMFLTPDTHLPIFAGTYFPKSPGYGMPAFKDVLTRVESYYRQHRDEVERNGAKLLDAFERMHWGSTGSPAEPSRVPIVEARRRLGESFDAAFGGFGGAPKFPHPTSLDLLLRLRQQGRSAGNADVGAEQMLERSLSGMALGGLYDQLGGGFFRYCVDAHWGIPHFEKMLYDNAALLATFSDAFAATGNPLYSRVANETADWALREMQDPRGGFYSALDADSEGEEGKFYVFTPADFDAGLTTEESAAAKARFGLEEPPNFEGVAWHLRIDAPAGETPPTTPEQDRIIDRARAKLLAARERRARPGRDEKCLVSWNGLMISGLARAARRLDRPDLGRAAQRAVDFIRAELSAGGRLKACFKDGRARFDAYLDDYALLAAGLVELVQWEFRRGDLTFALTLADTMLAHFADPAGGFFFTADDHEKLIHRPKPLVDEALPAGNAVAALALGDLGHLTGDMRYIEAAAKTVSAALPSIEAHPEAHATLLAALEREIEPPEIVVVRAAPDALARFGQAIDRVFDPSRRAFLIPTDAGPLPGLLAERKPLGDGVAYVCAGTECRAPITSPEQLADALARSKPGNPTANR